MTRVTHMAASITFVLLGCCMPGKTQSSPMDAPTRTESEPPLTVTLGGDGQGFHVEQTSDVITLHGQLPDAGRGPGVSLQLTSPGPALRPVWVPHLAPEPGYVMGDHAFRSPAIILAGDASVQVLIPDLDDVAQGFRAGWRTWMDFDATQSCITVGAGAYRTDKHVLFRRDELVYAGQPVRLRIYVLHSRDPRDVQNPFGVAARFLWQRWGRPRHESGGSQSAPLTRYAEYIVRWAFSEQGWGNTVWQEFTLDGRPAGGPAFIVDVAQHPSVPPDRRKWREPRSIWNQAWFSTQRCANGLYRYARQTDSADLLRRARLCTQLTLAAPQTDGLFPAVCTTAAPGAPFYALESETPGWDQARWTQSNRRPRDASADAFHIVDAAYTARQLLEWSRLTGEAEAREYAERFAHRLCTLQRTSGAFPGWVEPDGNICPTLCEGPETAVGATLLLELSELDPSERSYVDAARRALDYLEHGPVAEGRWEDFETYFSCCPWGFPEHLGKRVERSGLFKSNTLSIFWCAEAFLAAHRVLKDDRYLALGRRCLDELVLYQQVWDPPFIAAPAHGGFGVMNTDGEWNDARQSLFAPLLLEYGLVTGEPEYFERGVAALRASFIMLYCPENEMVRRHYEKKHPFFGPESYGFMMENIAHGGPSEEPADQIGPFTIYTWGNGAALAAAATVRDLYGDVYIDDRTGRAFGIDGCSATVLDGRVHVRDRFGRAELRAVYRSGPSRTVQIRGGRADLPLSP